jgi:tetratricopeptide (TPR) repeat protein
MATARTIHVEHAQGTLIGDHGLQINYYPHVTSGGDEVGLRPVQADLPARSQVLAGRDAYLAELLGFLDPEVSEAVPRVAVVCGMAGVGKSELVLHAAHAAVRNGWFPGGVLFAKLQGDGLELAQIALDGFLSAMEVPGDRVPADPRTRARKFSSVVTQYAEAGKPVLVVIDNAATAGQCELLVPAEGRALVTSRNELAILDARLVRLPVLDDQAGADLLAGQLGVSLGADTRVAGHREDARAVAELCGGLPLALRIVAAILVRNQARSLAAVAEDLRDARTRLDELAWEDGSEVLGVRAAFDVSYRALAPDRARVFRLLAVNPGPEISIPAAAVLAGSDEGDVRRHLAGLAGTHLIEPCIADGRWQMHDLIRLYAAEEPPEGSQNAHTRLMAYYADTADAAAQYLAPATYHPAKRAFAGRADALEWLNAEYPNLAAIALLPGPGFAGLAIGLWRYLELPHRVNDGILLVGHALLISRQVGDRRLEAHAQTHLTSLFNLARMFDSALAAGQAAVAAWRSLGDQENLGPALSNLAGAQMAAGLFEEAISAGREAVKVFQSLDGDQRHHQGIALGHIAHGLTATGRPAESIAAYRDVLAVMRETGDQRGEGAMLNNLGHALKEAGQLGEAIAAQEQAAATFADLGDRAGQGMALANLGAYLYLQDNRSDAIPALNNAIDALTEVGDTHSRGAALANLGQILAEDGHRDEAIKAFADAAADFRKSRDGANEGVAERHRGLALIDAGQPGQAADAFRAAARLAQQAGDRPDEAMALYMLGNALPQSQWEEAKAALTAATQAFKDSGQPELERAAELSLLKLKMFPSAEQLHARMRAGTINQVAPRIWMDVVVLGAQDTDEEKRIAEDLLRRARKAAGKAVREKPESAG